MRRKPDVRGRSDVSLMTAKAASRYQALLHDAAGDSAPGGDGGGELDIDGVGQRGGMRTTPPAINGSMVGNFRGLPPSSLAPPRRATV